jgi:Fe-S cluster assembly scaffold protein SufB
MRPPTNAQLLETVHQNQIRLIIPQLTQIRLSLTSLSSLTSAVLALSSAIKQQGVTMAEDFTALNQAIADLKSEVGTVASEMDQLLTDLNNAMSSGNQPAIDTATAALKEQIQALQDAAARDAPPAPSP